MKRNRGYAESHRAGPGASTVLMILLVMCLAMLGALSLATSRNDLMVTRRAAQAENAYYAAQAEAARQIAGTDESLARIAGEGDWEGALSKVEGYDSETGMIALNIPVDEYRAIEILMRPLRPGGAARYEIAANRVVITGEEIYEF